MYEQGGFACTSSGLVNPSGPCSAGYFCIEGSTSFTPSSNLDSALSGICPKGFSCPQQTDHPIKCLPGYYSDTVGLVSCKPCPAGSYCDGIDTTLFKPCPSSKYCPALTTNQVPECPYGTYSNQTGLISSDVIIISVLLYPLC